MRLPVGGQLTLEGTSPGLNPAVLRWAREWRGLSVDEVASKIRKAPDEIRSWEEGEASPTVNQARRLADLYSRPFLEFFFSEPPDLALPKLVPDYRMQRGSTDPDDHGLRLIQQWAEARRLDALDLFAELGLDVPTIPATLFATLRDDPERVAERARAAIDFPIETQTAMPKRDAYALPAMLRDRIERLGVLVLRRADLKAHAARGMSLSLDPLPVIVVQNEVSTGQAFTLAHELGHLLLREGAVSGDPAREAMPPPERWCDRFAGAFLMPRDAMADLFPEDRGQAAADGLPDEELARIASSLSVSPHAALVRLVQIGWVSSNYYWNVKKPEFDRASAGQKSFGRSKYYGARYRGQLGNLYTGLVLEAWNAGRITNHNAAEYLGIANLRHLDAIRREFVAS